VTNPQNPENVDQIADYRWLIRDDAAHWLEQAANDSRALVARVAGLRKSLSAVQARLVLEQVELRRRAVVKFPHAGQMFFTRKGLEQSTDFWVAAYKAARFPRAEPAADLCCGIGGDLAALALRGPAVGVDRDPVMALLAKANLQALGGGGASASGRVCSAEVRDFSLAEFSAWHIDPDRRPAGRRTTRVELHDPDSAVITRLLTGCSDAAIKLAPAAEFPGIWGGEAEAEWIGRDRQCRQLVVWLGRLARHPGRRCATILTHQTGGADVFARTVVGGDAPTVALVSVLGRYVLEPDPAVLAAGLAGTLAAEHRLDALMPDGGYLTGDHAVIDDPALACFEVLESLPFDLKRLKQLLAARDVGPLEIKKRGVAEDPQAIRKRLVLRGTQPAVLLIAPLGSSVTAMVCRRRRKEEGGRGKEEG
jgi:predicted RNA methylase